MQHLNNEICKWNLNNNCSVINILILVDRAHAQPVTQSEQDFSGQVARYAVDGYPTTCSSTYTNIINTYPWWQVDLQDLYTINYITVLIAPGIFSEL